MTTHGPNARIQDYQYDSRNIRAVAHRVFDTMWVSYGMTREQAYTWMRRTLKLGLKQNHIGLLSEMQCGQLIDAVHEYTIRQADRLRRRIDVRAAM